MKTAASLSIELGTSRLAAAVIFVAIVATAAMVAWLPGSPWLRGAAVIALGVYGTLLERTWALRSARSAIVALMLRPDLTVTLIDASGRRVEGSVLDDSFVAALLTTLVVRVPPARWPRTIAILPDMLAAEDFRRLRVQLRLGRVPPIQAGAAVTAPAAGVTGVSATPARR